ncbi:MAG: hypothetical protein ACJ760_01125 [Thermoleophilaceae bacterium]
MRRVALLTIALALGLCGSAAGFDAGHLTLDPRQAGTGTRLTIDLRQPRGSNGINAIIPQLARGTRFHDRAVARRCRNSQAAADDCPAGSRVGAGTASLEAEPGGARIPVGVGLYLAPRRRSDDIAGLVMVTRAPSRTGYGTGRVFELNPETYPQEGLQLQLERVRRAFFGLGIRDFNVHLGAHRAVAGRRVDLITNPGSCPFAGWPWTLAVGSLDRSQRIYRGAVDCSG